MGVVLQYIPVDWGLPVVEFGLLTDTRRLKMHFNDSENLNQLLRMHVVRTFSLVFI